VSQVVVVGDKQPFIAALITLDMEMLPTWLANNGEKKEMTLAEATTNPAVLAEIQRAVDHANTKVSRAESIRKFVVLPIELSEASGHLTPKLSIKRHVIVEDFADVIESVYEKAPSTEGLSLEH
jgi:long-chain acyl-CoA synthetase